MRTTARLIVATLFASSLVLTLPAAGSATTNDAAGTDRWVRAFCAGSTDWIDSLSTRAGAIPIKLGSAPEPAKVTAVLTKFFQAAVRSTKRFERRLAQAGPPDVPHGAQIARAITNGLHSTRRAFARSKADAAQLATSDITNLHAGAEAARDALEDALTKVGAEVDKVLGRYDSEELGDALRGEDACQVFLPPAP